MDYLASRLYKSEPISIESLFHEWRELAREVEPIDASTFRVWQTIEIIHEHEGEKYVYSLDEDRQPVKTVAITASCYLRVESTVEGTTFTIVAHKKEALVSVYALIECLYAPVNVVSLDAFLKKNDKLPVLAASLYEYLNRKEIFQTYDKPERLGNLVNNKPSKLRSFLALVNISAPPLTVRTLYINRETQQAGFSLETDGQDEWVLINNLFTLIDRTFRATNHL